MVKQKKDWSNYLLFFCILFLFIIDTASFYCTHYYVFYALSYFLLLQFFYNHHQKTYLTLFFLTLEWTFTTHAPLIALFLYFLYKKLSHMCTLYLYNSPSIPFVLCTIGWASATGILRLYSGHWPFPLSLFFILKAFFINIIGIILLNLLYYYCSKQGNR